MEKFERKQIDELRKQCLGTNVWVQCGPSYPDLGISIARCTGIKVGSGEFRLETSDGGLKIGTMIRERNQVFISDEEIRDFVSKWGRDICVQYGCHGYTVHRCGGYIVIRPIQITEDEWTGEKLVDFITAGNDFPACNAEELISKGYIITDGTNVDHLTNIVLNAVQAYRDAMEDKKKQVDKMLAAF